MQLHPEALEVLDGVQLLVLEDLGELAADRIAIDRQPPVLAPVAEEAALHARSRLREALASRGVLDGDRRDAAGWEGKRQHVSIGLRRRQGGPALGRTRAHRRGEPKRPSAGQPHARYAVLRGIIDRDEDRPIGTAEGGEFHTGATILHADALHPGADEARVLPGYVVHLRQLVAEVASAVVA